jgi:predicted transcriptional regulator
MEVNFRPETETRLQELASKSGRQHSDLIEDAVAGYLQELSEVRTMLDSRYDDLKNGRVKPLDGDEAFTKLRQKSKHRTKSPSDQNM